MLSEQRAYGARAAAEKLGALPTSLPATIRDQIVSSVGERTPCEPSIESVPERWRTELTKIIEGESELSPRAVRYLLGACDRADASPKFEITVAQIERQIDRFAVQLLASMSQTLDARMAAQIKKTIPKPLEDAWVVHSIDPDTTKLVRDGFIGLAKRDDSIHALGWYLTLFAIRDFPSSFVDALGEVCQQRQLFDQFRATVHASSRSGCTPVLFTILKGVIDGE